MEQRMIMWEQLAMYVTALPCPPLPVLVVGCEKRSDDPSNTEEEEGRYACSHDVIASLLVMAMQRCRKDLNEKRMVRQIEVTQALIAELETIGKRMHGTENGDAGGDEKAQEEAYAACQRFVGNYMHSFDDAGQATPGIRFAPLERVRAGDYVHSACSSWNAAQVFVSEIFGSLLILRSVLSAFWRRIFNTSVSRRSAAPRRCSRR